MADYTPRILAGRYEVGDLIGRGGMAEVHVGRDTRLGRTVAIKVLRSDLARDPAFQTRFRREAQAAASLNHPAIVAVYDTGEDVSTDSAGAAVRVPYIIMEYVEGHTLRELMRDGAALPIDEAIDITVGVLSALQYAHHTGIVHRDIKPANIMLTATGQVKVMDFGIARALADTAATMTQTQAVIGTAQYLSPEQARGETVDARSDLYSTGCVLYELLTGRPPFVGDSAVAVAYQHVRELPQPPSTLAPDVPDVLDRIVLKALAKDRDLRYSTASEFRGDLETAKRGGLVSAPVAAVPPVTSETRRLPPPVFPATSTTHMAPPSSPPPDLFPTPRSGDQEDEEDSSTRRKRWALIGIIGGVVVLALVVILIIAMNGRGGTPEPSPSTSESTSGSPVVVQIPAVAPGLTADEAVAELTALDLIGVPREVADPTIERGLVIAFDPPSGTPASPGDEVAILVSAGPDTLDVPDLTAMTQQAARTRLTELGLVAGDVTTENSPDVETNSITRTDPPMGETVPAGTEISLFVSNGRTVVPNVKGKLAADAQSTLEAAGLFVGEPTYKVSDEPAGTVLSQTPKAKEEVAQRAQVTLTVARAATKITIPTVLGLDREKARVTLEDLGLITSFLDEYSSTVPVGLVVRTDPEPGFSATEGGQITVYLSLGASQAPVAPPDVPIGGGGIETQPAVPEEGY
ncbi:MAG: Stk1 family PASTA domain-containing Ser/Thr kinase [Bifidobacteriaceae bacterium]|nr:Stk1 family PASTA domain-containing Ser/Thr kinase [Bifidobacteriaceae bacterium]